MITTLLIGAGVLWLISRKHQSGIGATKRRKRRIWIEVAEAQRKGIDLTDPNGWEKNPNWLDHMMIKYNVTPRGNAVKTPYVVQYFNQLRRAYKSISGIGTTHLPHDTYNITNEYGDVILTYNDYFMDRLPQQAADWLWYDALDNIYANPEESAADMTIAAIAQGQKFMWKDKGVQIGIENELFGRPAPGERKVRISYIATPAKGGISPAAFAEMIYERVDGSEHNVDDLIFKNGVLDAINTITSRGQAYDYCINKYIQEHMDPEDDFQPIDPADMPDQELNDLPF